MYTVAAENDRAAYDFALTVSVVHFVLGIHII